MYAAASHKMVNINNSSESRCSFKLQGKEQNNRLNSAHFDPWKLFECSLLVFLKALFYWEKFVLKTFLLE